MNITSSTQVTAVCSETDIVNQLLNQAIKDVNYLEKHCIKNTDEEGIRMIDQIVKTIFDIQDKINLITEKKFHKN